VKRWLLLVVLAASLGFNVFFALGFWRATWTLRQLQAPGGHGRLVAAQLDLDPEQRQRRDQLLERTRSESRALQAVQGLRAEFWAELAKSPPNVERVHALVDSSAELHTKAKHLAVDHIIEFLSFLRPDQRREYLKMIHRTTIFDHE